MVNVSKKYVPDYGDLIWLEFNPQSGHEQAGLRPALVISPASYNNITSLALMCPITSKIKGYPFEVVLPKTSKIEGAILSDQIKNLDWRTRKAKWIGKASPEIVSEVVAKIQSIILNS